MGECRSALCLCFMLAVASGANILAIFPAPMESHQSVYRTIWEELIRRGHKVTVITPNVITDETHENLTQVDLGFSQHLVFVEHNLQEILSAEKNLLKLMYHVYRITANLTQEQIKHSAVQKVIRRKEKFDLLIVETFMPAWYAFKDLCDCPMIGIWSLDALPRLLDSIGNPTHPYLYPDYNLPFGSELSFFERIISVVYTKFFSALNVYVIYPWFQTIANRLVTEKASNLLELEKHMSLLLVNVVPGFHKSRPTVPTLIELNGLHLKPQGKLPQDLQDYLDSAEEGVIYFSLGSTFRTKVIPEDKKRTILETLAELPYKILWKFESNLKDVPENVKVMRWFPQQDVLRHPNIKLFISQGGLQSVEEALAYNVPILGMPLFADQYYNIKRLVDLGLGKEVSYETLTKDGLKSAVSEIISNCSRYKSRLREISKLATDQPMKSLDKAMFWIEYVIRHKGADHLRSPAINVPFYKFYLLDAIGVLLLCFILLSYLYIKLLKCVIRRCLERLRRKNKQE